VSVGTIFLQSPVLTGNAVNLAPVPQGFSQLSGIGDNHVMTVTFTRPATPGFNSVAFVVPNNVRVDGLPWIMYLYADWRISTLQVWDIIWFNGTTVPYANGDTVSVNTLATDLFACGAWIFSTGGPIHQDAWTLTPTHTEPGSTGVWYVYADNENVDSPSAPTQYSYSLKIQAPFLLNNVTPQTADLSVTMRKADCTYETRLVHLRVFGIPAGSPTPLITSRTVTDWINGTITQVGAGPSVAFDIEWYAGDQHPVYSIQMSVVVSGTGPFTYQWRGTSISGDPVLGPWTNVTNSASNPYVTGATTNTLNLGGPIPGVIVTPDSNLAVLYSFYSCLVTNASGSIEATGFNLEPGVDF
jgi:hypothetical protein